MTKIERYGSIELASKKWGDCQRQRKKKKSNLNERKSKN